MTKAGFKNPAEYFLTKDAMKYNVKLINIRNANFIMLFLNASHLIWNTYLKENKINIKKDLTIWDNLIIFINSITLSQLGDRLCPSHYYCPPTGFLDPPTALELIRVVIGKGEGYTGPESTAHDEAKTFIKSKLPFIYLYLNFECL